MSKRAVFLDRDGVINKVVMREAVLSSPRSLQEFEFIEGVIEEISRLKNAGFILRISCFRRSSAF